MAPTVVADADAMAPICALAQICLAVILRVGSGVTRALEAVGMPRTSNRSSAGDPGAAVDRGVLVQAVALHEISAMMTRREVAPRLTSASVRLRGSRAKAVASAHAAVGVRGTPSNSQRMCDLRGPRRAGVQ